MLCILLQKYNRNGQIVTINWDFRYKTHKIKSLKTEEIKSKRSGHSVECGEYT